MNVVIVGAGIGGLTLGLRLHRAGIACRIYEAAPELKPLGVPVISGLRVGHGSVNDAVPFGVRARIDGAAGLLTFIEPIHAGANVA